MRWKRQPGGNEASYKVYALSGEIAHVTTNLTTARIVARVWVK